MPSLEEAVTSVPATAIVNTVNKQPAGRTDKNQVTPRTSVNLNPYVEEFDPYPRDPPILTPYLSKN